MSNIFQVFLLISSWLLATVSPSRYWEYCVIGAGPAGLQLGHYLQKANRDYMLFERGNSSGTFFSTYPRHNKLISINKRHTGKTNKEFNLRHDWNSLLSDDESLLFRHYSKEFFPDKSVMIQYLKDYQQKLGIKVQHNTDVSNIAMLPAPSPNAPSLLSFNDQHGNNYSCKTIVVATGLSKPNIPKFQGVEYTVGYEDVSINPDEFEGKSVLILGRGNSAFETADSILGATNYIHMLSRSRVRLAWSTHYVGDLRAVNNGLLDTYQLKSLDGILEAPVEDLVVFKHKDGYLYVTDVNIGTESISKFDNNPLRDHYDVIVRCLGFQFDKSIFSNQTKFSLGKGKLKKYPAMKPNFESVNIPNVFIAGTISHGLDHRKSAGGFIHGFRYTARTLFHILEWKNHQVPWPSVTGQQFDLLNYVIKRINEASGIYQMFQMLADVIILKDDNQFVYLEEYPLELVPSIPNVTGHDAEQVIVVVMEYGKNFSGPGKDVFKQDRAIGDPHRSFQSNFLHPVFYYYKTLPTEEDMKNRAKKQTLPTPDREHHILEDFLTKWTGQEEHLVPLRRFFEYAMNTDLREFFGESCMTLLMTGENLPAGCMPYIRGNGLIGESEEVTFAKNAGMLTNFVLKLPEFFG
ncbi:FAD-dependent oxidoreductase domain-containing protein 2-like [Tubulanus polymorphus]|uniref:FAD-dependent oxidoreductase domain-containing protein 2-like n=1 Tax=Tubulanus polymorphus TaxID=672921 RepID=UPI003DA2B080